MAGLGFEERSGGLKNLTARLIGDNERQVGTCKKCGFAGHLAFQCRNTVKAQTVQAEEEQAPAAGGAAAEAAVVDVSSTSSEESEDSILALSTGESDDSDDSVPGTYALHWPQHRIHSMQRRDPPPPSIAIATARAFVVVFSFWYASYRGGRHGSWPRAQP
eukprot:m.75999 g.75999  ORF g.75999 m.75999 type:complete len:161 (+) comp9032_c0_seq2:113-595(+)